MATSKAGKDAADKVFDVAKPGKSAASASSRPLIIGHKTILKDPMVKDDSFDDLQEDKSVKIDQPIEEDSPSGSPPLLSVDSESGEDSKKKIAAPSESKIVIKPLSQTKPAKSSSKLKESEDDNKITVKVSSKSAEKTSVAAAAVNAKTEAKVKGTDIEPVDNTAPDSATTETEAAPTSEEPDDSSETSTDEEISTEINDSSDTTSDTAEEKSVEAEGVEASSAALKAQKKAEQEDAAVKARNAELEKLVESRQYAIPIGEKTRKKRSLKHVLLGALLIILLGGALAYLMIDVGIIKANIKLPFEFFKDNNQTTSSSKTSEIPVVSDTTSKFNTFKSTLGKFSLQYPKTWKVESHLAESYSTEGEPVETATITSPSGIAVRYVLLDKQLPDNANWSQYSENTCGHNGACAMIIVNSIKKVNLKNLGQAQMVRMGTNKDVSEPGYIQSRYSTVLYIPDSTRSQYKVGNYKIGHDSITPSITIGRNIFLFSIDYPESLKTKTPDQLYAMADSKAAEEVIKSISFQ